MDEFKFQLGELVKIRVSGERGEVRGSAIYANAEPQYFVHYKAADGRAVSSWWDQDQIEAVSESEVKPG